MTRPRHFQITYSLSKTRRIFVQPDTHMTDEDAWYYACLHSGVGLLYGELYPQEDHARLVEHANSAGLTEVYWEELP
ncbi:hypothetical protein PS645_03720 [Pseudomonas fluorescens]|uniref:Uncharacterized protein n=1 Tax=Pseudomonas fluorescens TaxID=294 RepID=A0A5E6UX85_PSEFL|nr:DUF6555 family protein [Pseudomonas fluorescens]VVN09588.1 hypothetical protein PS645_03720 [Pseudomonas fluorescens]